MMCQEMVREHGLFKFWVILVLITGSSGISSGAINGCPKGFRAIVQGSLRTAAKASIVVTAPWEAAKAVKDHFFPKTSEARWNELRDMRVGDLLPADRERRTDLVYDPDVSDAQNQIFYDAFEEYLNNRDKFEGRFFWEREFRSWWKDHRKSLLSPETIQKLRDNDTHLDWYVYDAYRQFQRDKGKLPLLVAWRRNLQHPFALFSYGAVTTLVTAGILLRDLAVIGPGVQIANGYTRSVVQPAQQTANQLGTQELSWLANWEEAMLEKLNANERADLEKDLTEAVSELKGMSAEDLRQRHTEMHKKFFEILQRYGKAEPPRLQDGRLAIKDNLILTPLEFATSAAVFQSQELNNRNARDNLVRFAAYEHRELTKEELEQKEIYELQMKAADDRLAAALAEYQVYKMMYSEFCRRDNFKNDTAALDNLFFVFTKNLHFDLYQKHLYDQMEHILDEVKMGFPRH